MLSVGTRVWNKSFSKRVASWCAKPNMAIEWLQRSLQSDRFVALLKLMVEDPLQQNFVSDPGNDQTSASQVFCQIGLEWRRDELSFFRLVYRRGVSGCMVGFRDWRAKRMIRPIPYFPPVILQRLNHLICLCSSQSTNLGMTLTTVADRNLISTEIQGCSLPDGLATIHVHFIMIGQSVTTQSTGFQRKSYSLCSPFQLPMVWFLTSPLINFIHDGNFELFLNVSYCGNSDWDLLRIMLCLKDWKQVSGKFCTLTRRLLNRGCEIILHVINMCHVETLFLSIPCSVRGGYQCRNLSSFKLRTGLLYVVSLVKRRWAQGPTSLSGMVSNCGATVKLKSDSNALESYKQGVDHIH